VDSTFSKLKGLREYVADTEDLINIKLGKQRNRLDGTDLLFTTAIFALSPITIVMDIFGMYLRSGVEDSYSSLCWCRLDQAWSPSCCSARCCSSSTARSCSSSGEGATLLDCL
jgi:hypothetical protein